MEVKRGCEGYEKVLLPDEQVEWKGRPEPFRLLTEETKRSVLLQWVLCAVVCVALSVLYIAAVANSEAHFSIIVELVIIAACAFVAFTPIRDKIEVQKKAGYYVTNKRVILTVGDNFYALNRGGIKVERRRTGDGNLNVLFGSCVGMPDRKCRRAAILPEIDDEDLGKNGFVFYNVKQDADLLERLLFT